VIPDESLIAVSVRAATDQTASNAPAANLADVNAPEAIPAAVNQLAVMLGRFVSVVTVETVPVMSAV
jgi:hypothetical protein